MTIFFFYINIHYLILTLITHCICTMNKEHTTTLKCIVLILWHAFIDIKKTFAIDFQNDLGVLLITIACKKSF